MFDIAIPHCVMAQIFGSIFVRSVTQENDSHLQKHVLYV